MMKRASLDFDQSDGAVDDEARTRLKHQILLQEFLELQKEFVSKKRKLQTIQQKRDALLTEVRFLRQRLRYILKYQSSRAPIGQGNSDIQRKMLEGKGNYSAHEAALKNPYLVMVANPNMSEKAKKGEGEEHVSREALRVGKKPQSFLCDDKRVGKKKILCQDSVTLKV